MEEKRQLEDYEKSILKDIDKTISALKKNKSKSSYYYNYTDLEVLYEICELLGMENYPKYDDINQVSTEKKYTKFVSNGILNCYNCLEFLEKLVKNIDAFYKDIPDYKIQAKCPIRHISIENNFAYTAEFLKDFDKRYFNEFFNTVKDSRFIMMGELADGSCGYTYFSHGNFEPYVFIENYPNIFAAYTMTHETAHLYDNLIKKNWSSNEKDYSYITFSREINPYYTELMFIDYFKNKRILVDDLDKVFELFNYELKIFVSDIMKKIAETNMDENAFILDEELFKDINVLFGKAIALYIAATRDKNTAIKTITNILNETRSNDLIDSLTNAKVDINDIAEFGSASEYIRKRLK